MTIRRTHKDFVKSQAKASKVRMQATRLRDRVRASMHSAIERQQSRMSWWQRTFRTPLVGFYGWVRSRCRTLWAACLAILGISASAKKPALASRHGQLKTSKKANTRRLIHETMEQRQLLAADLMVIANDTFAQEDPSASPFPNTGQFTIQLTAADTEDVAVTYSLTGEANSEVGIDYKAEVSSAPIGKSGVIVIPAGKTQVVVDIDVQDDDLYDAGNEDVILTVSNAETVTSMTPLGLTTPSAKMEIVDNETAAPTVSISASDATAAEPSNTGKFTITQSGKSDTDTNVTLTLSGSADVSDYTIGSKSLTISAASTQASTVVTPTSDTLVEGSETVVATIDTVVGNAGIAKASPTSATVTIDDTEDKATVKISNNGDATATENPIDNAKFTISMSEASSTDTVIKYVVGGDAVEGTDYTFGVTTDDDASNNTIAGPQGSVGPQGLAGFSLAENKDIANSKSIPHLTVNSPVNDGSADVYAFYTATGGAATFDIDNSIGGFNSVVELFDSSGKLLAFNDDSASIDTPGSITKDDSFLAHTLPAAGVYYVRVTESKGSNKGSLGATNGADVGEGYELHFSVPGSTGYAVIGAGDKSIDLPVILNDSTYNFDDLIIEGNEQVKVNLDSIVQADPQITLSTTAADLKSDVTIIDNDAVIVTVTGTKDALEPSTNGEFTIALPMGVTSSADTVVEITYDASSSSKNATTAKINPNNTQDHKMLDVTTVTIAAGKNSVALPVEIIDNTLIEENELAKVSITKITNNDTKLAITGVGNTGDITIGDNDTATVDVDATFAPAIENTKVGKFTFFLSEPPGFPTGNPAKADRGTTVQFEVTGTALIGDDYKLSSNAVNKGGNIWEVTIPAFASSTDVEIITIDDPDLEGTETVKFEIKTLEAPTDSNIKIGVGSPADTMDILDDDFLSVKIEGTKDAQEGVSTGEFTLSLVGAGVTTTDTIVTYEVVTTLSTAIEDDGVAGAPIGDFAKLSGTAKILAGKSATTITIDPTGMFDDVIAEGTEIVTVKITGATGTGIVVDAMDQDSIDIKDNDLKVVDITSTVDGFEAFGGTGNGSFDVTLGGTSSAPVVVEYQVFNLPPTVGAATPGVDYTAIGTGTVTIDPFTLSKTIPVEVINDMTSEDVENVDIKISKVISGPYSPGASGTVQIFSDVDVFVGTTDSTGVEGVDDGQFAIYMKYEDAAGTVYATSDVDTVVTYDILTGNPDDATNGTDYAKLTGVATIKAGQTSVTIDVDVTDDMTLEAPEQVRLRLTGITSSEGDVGLAGTKSTDMVRNAIVTIADDDAAYFTVKATKTPGEDNPGADVDGEFTVFVSQPSDVDTIVTYTVATGGNSATPDADYTKLSGSVLIKAGQTSATIDVDVLDDLHLENTETVKIALNDPATYTTDGKMAHPYVGDLYLGALGAITKGVGQSSVVTFASDDTYVDSGQDTSNFGGLPLLQTFTGVVGKTVVDRQTLLTFGDLIGTDFNQVPANSPITGASLKFLNVVSNGQVAVFSLLTPFDESSSTWNSPFTVGNLTPGVQNDGFEASMLPTALGPIGSGLTVTADVEDWLSGMASNFGWALLPNAFNSPAIVGSSEGAPPVLFVNLDVSATVEIVDNDTASVQVVGFTPAQEPGTAGNIIVGLVDGFGNQVKADSAVTFTYSDVTLAGGPGAKVATPGSDYPLLSGNGTISAGQTQTLIDIVPNDDSLVEDIEAVKVKLLTAKSADPQVTLGTGTTVDGETFIIDNDFAFVTIVGTEDGNEDDGDSKTGNPDPVNGEFVVTLSTASSVETVVSISTGGSADEGADYKALPTLITIPANQTSTTITIDVIDDDINEAATESVKVQLTGKVSGNAAIAIGSPSQDTIDIIDDEQPILASAVATKGTAIEQLPLSTLTQDGELQIQLNFASDQDTVVEFTITGTADDDDPGFLGIDQDYDATQFPGLDLKAKPIIEGDGLTDLQGKVTIKAGQTNAVFPVDVLNDYVQEGNETVTLTITKVTNLNQVGPAIGKVSDTVTIQDGVYEVSVEKTDSPAQEPGPAGGSNGQFTFSITAPLPHDVIANYSVGGTAIATPGFDPNSGLADYKGLSGVVTIPANTTQVTLDVEVIDDLLLEGDETVEVTLTSASSSGASYVYFPFAPTISVDSTTAIETIQDNDVATLSVAGFNGQESKNSPAPGPGYSSLVDGKFVITQSLPTSVDTVITYEIDTKASSATAGMDYKAITGTQTATILAGKTQAVVEVDVFDDTTLELTENVAIKLAKITSSDPQVTFASKTASLDIVDDDTAIVSITPMNPVGFEPGTNDGSFVVTLSNPSSVATVVTFSVDATDPTRATMGDDYLLRENSSTGAVITNQITVPANQTQAVIVVDVLDDGIVEDTEPVKLNLTATDNVKITPAVSPATVFIMPDNDKMKVSIAGTKNAEEAGSKAGEFTLTLTNANPGTVLAATESDTDTVVTYTITGGTATTGGTNADHTLLPTVVAVGTATIAAGKTQVTVSVPVVDDNLAELTENLEVTLGAVTKGHTSLISVDAGKSTASIDILDDDASVLTITSPTVDEDAGTIKFVVTNPSNVDTMMKAFTVDYKITDLTTGGVGGTSGGNDLGVAVPSTGSLTFPSGKAGATTVLTLPIVVDSLVEADEQFEVKLTGSNIAAPLVVTGAVGTGTITNDDTATFKINDVSVTEGTSLNPALDPNFTDLKFTITLDNPVDIDTVIDIDFADLTAFGGDFDPLLALKAPNNKIPVLVSGFDYDNDAGETADKSADKVTYTNGTISSVKWTADEVTQFDMKGNVIGGVTKEFTVRIVQDNIVEGGVGTPNPMGVNDPGVETFEATIASDKAGVRSIVTTDKGKGTIVDDDTAEIYIDIAASDLKASEPLDTVNEMDGQFVIVQTAISSSDTVITYDVTGTADHKGSDYTPLSGTVTVKAGTTSAVIDVAVVDSLELEDDETVKVTITGFASRDPNVTKIANTSPTKALDATVTIFDDDQALVTVEATDPDASEDPLDDGEFTLTLSEISDTDTVVTYQMLNQTIANPERATNGADYKALSGVATIPAGLTQTTILVDVLDDVTVEGAEDVIIQLTGTKSPSNADIKIGAMDQATVVIADDIDGILISVMNNGDGIEGTGAVPSQPGSFVVKLTKDDGVTPVNAPAGGLTINYSSLGGTASPGSGSGADYNALSGTLFIPAGQSTGLIDVNVLNDAVLEGNETVQVTLQPPLGGYAAIGGEAVSVGQASDIVNIIDDEAVAPKVESVEISGGDVQRSGLKTIEVVFDQQVTVATGAIKVFKRDDLPGGLVTVGEVGGVTVSSPDYLTSPGKTIINVTFTPSSTFVDAGGSLEDGNYQLEISDSGVVMIGGNILDGDNNGVGGGDYVFGNQLTDGFYRLYGDADGNGVVNFDDILDIALPEFGTTSMDPGFKDYLDGNNDGVINFDDILDLMLPKFGEERLDDGFPS